MIIVVKIGGIFIVFFWIMAQAFISLKGQCIGIEAVQFCIISPPVKS